MLSLELLQALATDYTLANGTLTINAGATSGTITIAGIVDDSIDEANETVIVTLSESKQCHTRQRRCPHLHHYR